MIEPEARTYETADGSALPMVVWRPAGARHALLYLHGIQSHSGWYAASSRRLAEAGVAVYQVERRGSGTDTEHERGHVEGAETWLEDTAVAAETACAEVDLGRLHLMGVSWGGKLALAAGGARPDLYRSLILAAPGLVPQVDMVLATKARIVRALVSGRPRERFAIPLADPALFTANPSRRRFIAEDPLSLREVTARFLFESRRLDRLARRAARRSRLPLFLALAGRDRIIDNQATRRMLARMPSDRARTVVYPEGRHTLEFEPDPERYLADLVAWVTSFAPE